MNNLNKPKPSLFFTMRDVNNEIVGKGKFYPHGGNIQVYWHKYTPDAGAIQYNSLGEALLMKGVHSVEWDIEQEGRILLEDGWYDESEVAVNELPTYEIDEKTKRMWDTPSRPIYPTQSTRRKYTKI